QQGSFNQVLLQGADDLLDENRVVGRDIDEHASWHGGSNLLVDAFLHFIDNGHGVGVGYLDDADADGGLTVIMRQLALVFQAVLNFRDVFQLDWRAIAEGDDHLGNITQFVIFQIKLEQLLGLLADQKTAGQLYMFVIEGGDQILGHDVVSRHALGDHIDANAAIQAATQ